MIVEDAIVVIEIMDGGTFDPLGRGRQPFSRRSFFAGSAAGSSALGLADCATPDGLILAEAAKIYGPTPDEKNPIPAADISTVDPK
ncbi:hypothetical protein MBUL_04248 [Methylobacterium bullatum]|uniref:Uncharacterized protein n=1 Tax=Methylobacterium bullatum TaxID=570505 RepID=A0A679JFR6_9HYPH|nr:hypothetical protein MBUL_04248 [Methylobacterium bullatum]